MHAVQHYSALGFLLGIGQILAGAVIEVATFVKEQKKRGNTNPFNGAVDEEVIVVDPQGNAIPVKEGNWLGGSKDGVWIEEKCPGANPRGEKTGLRKDGKGHPQGPAHPDDPRAWQPHGHVPGVTNPDGTPWLPIN